MYWLTNDPIAIKCPGKENNLRCSMHLFTRNSIHMSYSDEKWSYNQLRALVHNQQENWDAKPEFQRIRMLFQQKEERKLSQMEIEGYQISSLL